MVDIAGLGILSGEFDDAITDALVAAAKQKKDRGEVPIRPIVARIICGQPPGQDIDPIGYFIVGFVNKMHGRLNEAGVLQYLNLYVLRQQGRVWGGEVRGAPVSWNHAKIVAADGRRLLTGGHNWWGADYLHERPIFDLSVYLEGPVACDAHQLCENIWGASRRQHIRAIVGGKGPLDASEAPVVPQYPRPAGGTRILSVAQPGLLKGGDGESKVPSAGRLAWYLAMERARESIDLSQQDIFSGGGFRLNAPEWHVDRTRGDVEILTVVNPIGNRQRYYCDKRLFEALAGALKRNVRVRIVLTNPDAKSRLGFTYATGAWPEIVMRGLAHCLMTGREPLTREQAYQVLADENKLELRTIGFDNYNYWRDGSIPIGNHAKFWAVDKRMFYVGSLNAYPDIASFFGLGFLDGHLTEWGVIVEGEAETAMMLRDGPDGYFGNLLRHAQRVLASRDHLP